MSELEALRRAKTQLLQLQGYVDELYEKSGSGEDLQDCVQLVQKADLTVQELRDRWPTVQKLLKQGNANKAAASQPVQEAWQVHEARSWVALAKEHSSVALGVIQHHLQSHIKLPQPDAPDARATKRPRPSGPSPSAAAELQGVVQRVRQAVPTAEIYYFCAHVGLTGTAETANEVRLVLPKVLVACIPLLATGTAAPVRVVLDSVERKADANGWAHHSQLQVFRRVAALAARALCYYTLRARSMQQPSKQQQQQQLPPPSPPPLQQQQPPPQPRAQQPQQLMQQKQQQQPLQQQRQPQQQPSAGAVALEDLLLWLCSYQDLFTRPCQETGKLLAWDPSMHQPVPPVFRPYMLSRKELAKAAVDPASRKAYHLHHAPVELLSWHEEDNGSAGQAASAVH